MTFFASHPELTGDLSYVKDGGLGQHIFQAGLQWKPRSRIVNDTFHPGNGRVFSDEVRRVIDGELTSATFHRQFRAPTLFTAIAGVTTLFGFYFQDK